MQLSTRVSTAEDQILHLNGGFLRHLIQRPTCIVVILCKLLNEKVALVIGGIGGQFVLYLEYYLAGALQRIIVFVRLDPMLLVSVFTFVYSCGLGRSCVLTSFFAAYFRLSELEVSGVLLVFRDVSGWSGAPFDAIGTGPGPSFPRLYELRVYILELGLFSQKATLFGPVECCHRCKVSAAIIEGAR